MDEDEVPSGAQKDVARSVVNIAYTDDCQQTVEDSGLAEVAAGEKLLKDGAVYDLPSMQNAPCDMRVGDEERAIASAEDISGAPKALGKSCNVSFWENGFATLCLFLVVMVFHYGQLDTDSEQRQLPSI